MIERDPYALLIHDNFLGEFVDDDRTPATFSSLDSARWGALALSEDLRDEQRTLGGHEAVFPYTIYIVGPDGSRTQDSAS